MDSPDLSDWVAVKDDLFRHIHNDVTDFPRFICGWNSDESKIAITLHEGCRKASDQSNKNRACLLSPRELYHIHKQFCLIDANLITDFPREIKPNYVPSRKKYDYLSSAVEHYLDAAVKAVGKKIVLAVVFGDEDPLSCYEENLTEFRQKTLENALEKASKELEEILQLRERAESLLQVTSIYALEDQISSNIFDCLAELYNFQLQPFLQLREVSRSRMKAAKVKLSEEVGPAIKEKAEKEFYESNEDILIAAEALQQLYQEYYRKTLNLVLGQRDRMISDKKKFGKVAFELHGMPRLLKLEVQVCQEELKLRNALKGTKEYQRDKIKNQLAYLNFDESTMYEIRRIEEEVTQAQIGVLNSSLDILEVEERLHKSQLAILNKEFKDNLEIGVFFDAVENPEDLAEVDTENPQMNPKAAKLKEKLNRIYRKRAVLRNKIKSMLADIKRKQEKKVAIIEQNRKASTMTQKRKEIKIKELSEDKLAAERKKTLQRLKEYRKKALHLESMNQSGFESDDSASSLQDSKQTQPDSSKKKQPKPVTSVPRKDSKVSESSSSKTNDVGTSLPPAPPPPPPTSLPLIPPSSLPSVPSALPPPPPPPPSGTQPSAHKQNQVPSSTSVKLPEKSNLEITQDGIASQLNKLKKPVLQEVKNVNSAQPFNLEEILSIRSKLKAPVIEKKPDKGNGGTDFTSLLQATMKRIRVITEDSDVESDSDSIEDE